MVALGVVMLGFAVYSLWLRYRDRLFDATGFLRGLTWMIPAPFVAVLAGWFVTEIGRSPWLVWESMRYNEAVTPSLTGGMALFSLVGFILVYAVIFIAGIYYLTRIVRAGMDEPTDLAHSDVERASRPLSAVHVPFDPEEAR
jgi:cytochrome d ubiquinol oxidase subunit I